MYDEKNPYNMHASCQLNPLLYYLNLSQIATFEAGTASTLASGIYFVREWTCHRAQVSPLVALYISILIFLFVSNLLDTFRMTVPCVFVLLLSIGTMSDICCLFAHQVSVFCVFVLYNKEYAVMCL